MKLSPQIHYLINQTCMNVCFGNEHTNTKEIMKITESVRPSPYVNTTREHYGNFEKKTVKVFDLKIIPSGGIQIVIMTVIHLKENTGLT